MNKIRLIAIAASSMFAITTYGLTSALGFESEEAGGRFDNPIWGNEVNSLSTNFVSSVSSRTANDDVVFTWASVGGPRIWTDEETIKAAVTVLNIVPTNNIIYVDQAVTTSGDGSSWGSAVKELADALKWAHENKARGLWSETEPLKIYVAKGTYKPMYTPEDGKDFSADAQYARDRTFLMLKDVELYGGFNPANGVTELEHARILPGKAGANSNGTILSGDLDGNDVIDPTPDSGAASIRGNEENVYHVVMAADKFRAIVAKLDGFTITGGNANSTSSIKINSQDATGNSGSGIYFSSDLESFITLTNSSVNNNSSISDGGGIYIYSDYEVDIMLRNSSVNNNRSGGHGGGISASTSRFLNFSSVTLTNSWVNNNSSTGNGGGVYSSSDLESSITLTNSWINNNNSSTGHGGGIYSSSKSGSSYVTLRNSLVNNNSSTGNGSAIYSYSPLSKFKNVKLYSSTLAGNIGPSYIYFDGGVDRSFVAHNSLICGNIESATNSSNSVLGTNDSGDLLKEIKYSLVQDVDASRSAVSGDIRNNNLDGTVAYSNLFVDAAAGDYSLANNSPAIDAGSSVLYGGDVAKDLDVVGNPRVMGHVIDIGAYENQTISNPLLGNILYVNQNVDQDAAGYTGFGGSWADAIPELADALKWANENKMRGLWSEAEPLKIYVAKGTYKPLYTPEDGKKFSSNERYKRDWAFLILRDMELYGGFDPANGVTELTHARILPSKDGANPNGTILSGDLDGNDVIGLTPDSGASPITGNEENAHHVVIVADKGQDVAVKLDGFTITGGNANIHSHFFVNQIETRRYSGGGISSASASVTLTNSSVNNNNSIINGGGIYSSSVTLMNSSVNNNTGSNSTSVGGGIACTSVTLTNSLVNNNTSGGNGGGISSSSVTLTNSSVHNNTSNRGNGGGISSASVTLTNSSVNSNTSKLGSGGGISCSSVTLMNSSVNNNRSNGYGGGGIYSNSESESSSVTLTNSSVNNNRSSGYGGGVYSSSSASASFTSVTLTNSSVNNNTGHSGGGIYSSSMSTSFSSVTLTNSSVNNNTSSGSEGSSNGKGGGIYSASPYSSVTLRNSSVNNNSSHSGGAIYSIGYSSDAPNPYSNDVKLYSSTLVGNIGPSYIYFEGERNKSFVVHNSLIYANAKSTTDHSNSVLEINKSNNFSREIQYSLVQGIDAGSSTVSGDIRNNNLDGTVVYSNLFVDAAAGDYSLAINSPAIDAGSNALYDGDLDNDLDVAGNARLYNNTIDIGAYEHQGVQYNPGPENILYVNQVATASGDGSSWSSAVPELADALKWAHQNKASGLWSETNPLKIYVAKGTYNPMYTPEDGKDFSADAQYARDRTFLMVEHVELYGGFDPANGVTELEHARILPGEDGANPNGTILSGDLNGDDDANIPLEDLLDHATRQENAYHVVLATEATSPAVVKLDGFTITGGNASPNSNSSIIVNSKSVKRNFGGGIYSYTNSSSSSVGLTNSSVTHNSSAGDGGGIYSWSFHPSSVSLLNSLVAHNSSGNDGGGIYSYSNSGAAYHSSSVSLLNSSVVHNNSARNGGGIYSFSFSTSFVSLTNSSVNNNSSTVNGGGIYSYSFSSSAVSINSSVNNNRSGGLGGGIFSESYYSFSSSIKLLNSNLIGNKGSGAMYYSNGDINKLTVHNSIIYGNKDQDGNLYTTKDWLGANKTVAMPSGADLMYKHSLVQGDPDAENGNLIGVADPKFVDADNGDYSLQAGSPLINAGDNSLYIGETLDLQNDKDLAGDPRLSGCSIDIGAYENQSNQGELCLTPGLGNIIYVDQAATAGGDGSSWGSAVKELADALKWAHENKARGLWSETEPLKIYVAKGTYKPLYTPEDGKDFSSDAQYSRDRTFLMVENVELYGGFDGVETTPAERSIPTDGATGTILSGDFNGDDDPTGSGKTLHISNNGENAYHVVTAVNGEEDIKLLIDGFEIKGGNANGNNNIPVKSSGGFTRISQNSGGGIYMATYGSITLDLKNARVSGNNAGSDGGGICLLPNAPSLASASPNAMIRLDNAHIVANYSGNNGGGIYHRSYLSAADNPNSITSDLLLDRSSVCGNYSSLFGGGIYTDAVSNSKDGSVAVKTTMNWSRIEGNWSGNNGGGLNANSSRALAIEANNTEFSANGSGASGAAIHVIAPTGTTHNNSIKLNNSTIAGNKGSSYISFSGGKRTFAVNNSIVLGNTKTDNSNSTLGGLPTKNIQHSLVQGESGTANGNINATGIAAADVYADFVNSNYSLKLGAVTIGTGSNDLYNGGGLDIARDKDLAGNPRLFGSTIDMGAYEFQQEVAQEITALPVKKTYGDAVFEPSATVDSGKPLTYSSSDASVAEVYQDGADNNKWKVRIKKAGTVTLTASQAGGNGYLAAQKDFVLVVDPKPVTISIVPSAEVRKIYDGATQGSILTTELSFAANDVVGNDDVRIALNSNVVSYDTKAVGTGKKVTLDAGSVTLDGVDAANYTISNTVALTASVGIIEVAPLTIRAKDANKAYDGVVYAGGNGVTYDGFVPGESEADLSGSLDYEGDAQGATDVGEYTILPKGLTSGNYAISFEPGKLTIEKATLPVFTFADATFTYDGMTKALAATGLPADATVNYTNNDQTAAGVYMVTAKVAGGSNYLDGSQTAKLTIEKAALPAFAFADATYTYDGMAKALEAKGLPDGATASYTNNDQINAGEYTVTAKVAGGSNYLDGSQTAVLRIEKAALPAFTFADATFTYDGMAKALVAKGLPDGATASYTNNDQINAGEYTVTAEVDGGKNYRGTATKTAKLIVKKATQTIGFNAPDALSRDAGTVALDVSSTSGLPVTLTVDDPSVATVSGTDLQVHRLGTVNITATQLGDANHEAAAPVSVTIKVKDGDRALPVVLNKALSPNGDGINDFLVIDGIQDYPENKVTIFDKNGAVLAEIEGYNNREKVFTGKDSRDGTYYYYLDVRDNGVWKREKGYFVIRR